MYSKRFSYESGRNPTSWHTCSDTHINTHYTDIQVLFTFSTPITVCHRLIVYLSEQANSYSTENHSSCFWTQSPFALVSLSKAIVPLFFLSLSWYVLYSFYPFNNQKKIKGHIQINIHVKLNGQGESRQNKKKGVWTLPSLCAILYSHNVIQPQQPLNNFSCAKLWLSPRFFFILFPLSGGFLPITGSRKYQHNILWKTPSIPPSVWQVPHYSPWQHPLFLSLPELFNTNFFMDLHV